MIAATPFLPLIWAVILAFAVFAYAAMDGFDLGVGILFPFLPDKHHRDVAMASIAPVWDGNETWLVLGGGGLFAAFPLAFAVVMPAVYTPIIAMLVSLVFRGVAFEFRGQLQENKKNAWDAAFFLGSLMTALSQGIVLGAILQGIKVVGRQYAGGWWNWLTPFTMLTGASLVAGYALLGACWLILRTDGGLQERAYKLAKPLTFATLAAIAAVSAATPFLANAYFRRWLSWPNILVTSPVPLCVAVLGWILLRALSTRREHLPFRAALGLFVLCFLGLGISFYPFIVPDTITIAAAAAPPQSQSFLLVGVVVMVPIILIYTALAYWRFRGKVKEGLYH